MSSRVQVLEDLHAARVARETVLERVAAGTLGLADAFALASTHREVAACYVTKLVEAVPGVGKVRGRRLLADLGIPSRYRCVEMSNEVRDAILGGLQ